MSHRGVAGSEDRQPFSNWLKGVATFKKRDVMFIVAKTAV